MALTDKLSAIADAIRVKTGKTDTMTLEQMPTEIMGITTGGGTSPDVRYVTFMNGTEVLYKKPVAVGDDCVDVLAKGLISTPTKASTAQYNYTYYGWGASDGGAADANILKNITEDKTVYAIFTATARLYTITFYDDDGTTVLATKEVPYGTVPNYTPTKTGVSFGGWTPTPTAVTGEASYTASWKSAVASGSCGTSATWSLDADYVLTISGTGKMNNYTVNASMTPAPWKDYRSKITGVVINDGITYIGDAAFASCSVLQTVSFSDTVKTIGENAFDTSGLKSVTIPKNITAIYRAAFRYCFSLTSVTFEETTGWKAGSTALSETDLSDPAKAATCLKTTYADYDWSRSAT